MTGDEPAAYLAARAGIDDVDDRLRTRMAAFSARSHAGRASAPWFGAARRRTVVSGRRGGVEGGGATVVSGRRWRQWCGRGGAGVGAASRAAGRRRWERRGEGDRGRGRGRERGSIRSRGGTILMAHHPSVRHKYIHANGAPHPGAPLVFFFTSARANRLSTT